MTCHVHGSERHSAEHSEIAVLKGISDTQPGKRSGLAYTFWKQSRPPGTLLFGRRSAQVMLVLQAARTTLACSAALEEKIGGYL